MTNENRNDPEGTFGYDPSPPDAHSIHDLGTLKPLLRFPLDFPIVTPPFSDWHPCAGVTLSTPIPGNAKVFYSQIYLAPAPRSAGFIPIVLTGTNIKLWRFIGMARNGYGSPGRPEGPFAGCGELGVECAIGWCAFGGPGTTATGPNQITASTFFSTWSSDYPRFAYWILLATHD
jgi:hypothetical protein